MKVALFYAAVQDNWLTAIETIGNVSPGTARAVPLLQALRDTAEAVGSRLERAMQGHITKFHEAIGCGVIRAADGRKYRFSKSDICNPDGRLVGLDVDFLVESRSPKDIILLHGSPWSVFAQRGPVGKRS